ATVHAGVPGAVEGPAGDRQFGRATADLLAGRIDGCVLRRIGLGEGRGGEADNGGGADEGGESGSVIVHRDLLVVVGVVVAVQRTEAGLRRTRRTMAMTPTTRRVSKPARNSRKKAMLTSWAV